MIFDRTKPLYALSVGEYMDLTRHVVVAVLKEHGIPIPETSPPPELSKEEEHFTLGQMATFLDCSLVSVHKYKKQGMPYYKIGRKVFFKKSEVLDFMRSLTRRLRPKKKTTQ